MSIDIAKILFDHMFVYNYRTNYFVTEPTKISFQNIFLDFQKIENSLDLHFFESLSRSLSTNFILKDLQCSHIWSVLKKFDDAQYYQMYWHRYLNIIFFVRNKFDKYQIVRPIFFKFLIISARPFRIYLLHVLNLEKDSCKIDWYIPIRSDSTFCWF